MPTTSERIANILTSKYHVPADRIAPDATLESLGLDSLDLIELLFEVEDEFHIRVPQEGGPAVKASTLQDIVNTVDTLVAQEAGASELPS